MFLPEHYKRQGDIPYIKIILNPKPNKIAARINQSETNNRCRSLRREASRSPRQAKTKTWRTTVAAIKPPGLSYAMPREFLLDERVQDEEFGTNDGFRRY